MPDHHPARLEPEEIASILSMDNLILRNLRVTQGYFQLSEGMKAVLGEENVSWCTFATHASKTAGYSIRHELLPDELARVFLSFRFYRWIMGFMRRFLSETAERERKLDPIMLILTRISLSISEGNTMVFAELAPAFSEMIAAFAGDAAPDEGKLQAFVSRFAPGPSENGGQDACVAAFSAYFQARFETDPKQKAELVYLGNLLIGLHEQTRLQPVIAASIHAPVDEILNSPFPLYITPLGKWVDWWVQRAIRWISRRVFATIATQMVMAIYTPAGRLRLGADVPAVSQDQQFPDALEDIEDMQIAALLDRFDRSRNSLVGSRAVDWSELNDRMNYIVDLFRSHQQDPVLFAPPFTAEQTIALLAGQIPEGKL